MRKYLKLYRVEHYIKNLLIFLPLFFGANLLKIENFANVIFGFFVFCLLTSCIYIFNDLIDIEQDKHHSYKKDRPIASGSISKLRAKIILIINYVIIVILQFLLYYFNRYNLDELIFSSSILLIYSFINLLYSLWLKHIPIIDVIVLASGFLLRVIYGGIIVSINISSWLYLTILSISLYMALGKRKNELKNNGAKSRKALSYYTIDFLDKYMYVFLTASIVFYSLWCTIGFVNPEKSKYLLFSIILVIFIVMRYSLDLESYSVEDPIDLIYYDKILLISAIFYTIYMGVIIYAKC